MNFHKSKGKEFDGVVMVEGRHWSRFFNEVERTSHSRPAGEFCASR
jgi:hypothetical protein